MKCTFCSFEFNENVAHHSCAGCFKLGGCKMIKCPRCNYESPIEPEWLKRISRILGKELKQ